MKRIGKERMSPWLGNREKRCTSPAEVERESLERSESSPFMQPSNIKASQSSLISINLMHLNCITYIFYITAHGSDYSIDSTTALRRITQR